jgi:hypothetical protein
MINEYQSGKDAEGSDCGLILDIILASVWRD